MSRAAAATPPAISITVTVMTADLNVDSASTTTDFSANLSATDIRVESFPVCDSLEEEGMPRLVTRV